MLHLYTIFFGPGLSLALILEVVFRTVFIYIYAFLHVRFVGKRTMQQDSSFKFVSAIALATAVGDAIFHFKSPIIYPMAAITTLTSLERFMTILSAKSDIAQTVIEGTKVLIIERGKVNEDNLLDEGMDLDELYRMLRLKGVEELAEVKHGFLEPSGKLSIIKYDKKKKAKGKKKSTLKDEKDTKKEKK